MTFTVKHNEASSNNTCDIMLQGLIDMRLLNILLNF